MIGPGTGVRVYLACGVTDMRKGITGLAAVAQQVLNQIPTSGAVFAFRRKWRDRDGADPPSNHEQRPGGPTHGVHFTHVLAGSSRPLLRSPSDSP